MHQQKTHTHTRQSAALNQYASRPTATANSQRSAEPSERTSANLHRTIAPIKPRAQSPPSSDSSLNSLSTLATLGSRCRHRCHQWHRSCRRMNQLPIERTVHQTTHVCAPRPGPGLITQPGVRVPHGGGGGGTMPFCQQNQHARAHTATTITSLSGRISSNARARVCTHTDTHQLCVYGRLATFVMVFLCVSVCAAAIHLWSRSGYKLSVRTKPTE